MELTAAVKHAIYKRFADTGAAPSVQDIARDVGSDTVTVTQIFAELREQRVLLLEPDGVTIRMAPPFSGIETTHIVRTRRETYYANCAWDALGIAAALNTAATVRSRCAHTLEPLKLHVGIDGPAASPWVFHSLVPAAQWWNDLVHT